MSTLHDCRAVIIYSCNNLQLSVHNILVIILPFVNLNIKVEYIKKYKLRPSYYLWRRLVMLWSPNVCNVWSHSTRSYPLV